MPLRRRNRVPSRHHCTVVANRHDRPQRWGGLLSTVARALGPSRRRRRSRQVRSRRIRGTACPAEAVGNGVSAGRPGGPDSGPPPGDGDSPAPHDQRERRSMPISAGHPGGADSAPPCSPVPERQGASLGQLRSEGPRGRVRRVPQRPPRAGEQSRGNGLLRIVDRRPVDLDRVEVKQSEGDPALTARPAIEAARVVLLGGRVKLAVLGARCVHRGPTSRMTILIRRRHGHRRWLPPAGRPRTHVRLRRRLAASLGNGRDPWTRSHASPANGH